jgi:hypothetical protein
LQYAPWYLRCSLCYPSSLARRTLWPRRNIHTAGLLSLGVDDGAHTVDTCCETADSNGVGNGGTTLVVPLSLKESVHHYFS